MKVISLLLISILVLGVTSKFLNLLEEKNEIELPEVVSFTTQQNIKIYIAGDSTVQSYAQSSKPQQGWGYYIGNYFSKEVSVENDAIGGRTAKTFVNEGRLDKILGKIKEGDYLFVQFGINDANKNDKNKYLDTCGTGNNPKEGTFEWYITKYVDGAKKKKAHPILFTTVIGLGAVTNGKFRESYGRYCEGMRVVASYQKIPLVDLNKLMVEHYNSIGYDAASKYHMIGAKKGSTDKTHFSEEGANAVAKIIAKELKKQNIQPLAKYIK